MNSYLEDLKRDYLGLSTNEQRIEWILNLVDDFDLDELNEDSSDFMSKKEWLKMRYIKEKKYLNIFWQYVMRRIPFIGTTICKLGGKNFEKEYFSSAPFFYRYKKRFETLIPETHNYVFCLNARPPVMQVKV